MRRLLIVDATIEVILASLIVSCAVARPLWTGPWAIASWLTPTILWLVATIFLATAVALFVLSRAPLDNVVLAVGSANVLGGLAVVTLSFLESGNGDAVRTVLTCIGSGVAALGIAQIRSSKVSTRAALSSSV